MSQSDQLLRFLFRERDVRGEVVVCDLRLGCADGGNEAQTDNRSCGWAH